MELKILAERIGLGKEATSEQIVERCHKLGDLLKEKTVEYETVLKALAESNVEALKGKEAQAKLVASEGRRIVEKAKDDQIIDKDDVEYWVERYTENPEATQKYIDGHRHRTVLAVQQSLKGVVTVARDPSAELAAATAEIMASNKKLSEAEAVREAYRRDPKLFERVAEARRAAAKKGGDR